jgi:glycerol-3-phosphate dehydrogenase subunit C
LMFKQNLPLMFPDNPDVQAVKDAMWDPFQYFVARYKDTLLKTDFKKPLGNVSYHVSCHVRAQNFGRKTEEMLKMIPETQVNTVESCSGHSGTWGVKKEFHSLAMKMGNPVFRQMATKNPDFISSDCQLAGHHIMQGIEELGEQAKLDKQPRLEHPITLIRIAYGLEY